MTRDDRGIEMTRRAVGKLVGGAATAGGAAAAGLVFMPESALAATTTLSASDVVITSNAGQLQTLTVQPDMEYEWNGLDNPPDRIDFYVETRLPNGSAGETTFEQVGTEGTTISSTALESSSTKTYSFQNTVSILAHSAIDDQDFEDTGDGWTKDTAVDVQVRTVLTDDTGMTYSDTPQDSFTVSLTNEQGSVTSGGTANTNGTAK